MSLYSTDRPEFIERIAALAGRTTYRTPSGSRSTKHDQLPDTHAIAAALAFARRSDDDIGPDVAYAWALQTDSRRERVTRRLSVALQCHEFRGLGAHRLAAAQIAWEVLIHNRVPPIQAPADCMQRTWDMMLLAAIGTLQAEAWDALARAERAYHRR